jgi:hypothetical protein
MPPSEFLASIAKGAANILKLAQAAPGVSVNQPQSWSGAGNSEYTITFQLFNTIKKESILQNIQLINRLVASTLHDQRTAILSSPPAIFEVTIPGIRYCPAAVIQQCVTDNIGQINQMSIEGLPSKVNVPDAYSVTLRITELIVESRQIFNAAVTNDFTKVKAISQEDLSQTALESVRSYSQAIQPKPQTPPQ